MRHSDAGDLHALQQDDADAARERAADLTEAAVGTFAGPGGGSMDDQQQQRTARVDELARLIRASAHPDAFVVGYLRGSVADDRGQSDAAVARDLREIMRAYGQAWLEGGR